MERYSGGSADGCGLSLLNCCCWHKAEADWEIPAGKLTLRLLSEIVAVPGSLGRSVARVNAPGASESQAVTFYLSG